MCDCIASVNDELSWHNAKITTNLLGPPRTLVDTYKIDDKKRGNPPVVQASFCPFCGEKYVE